jgi:regulator of sigma E protease
VSNTRVVGEVVPDSPAAKAGIQVRDEVLGLGGHPVKDWNELAEVVEDLSPGPTTLLYRHEGEERTATLDIGPLRPGENPIGVYPLRPAVVGTVKSGAPADRAGLQTGDQVVTINGEPMVDWNSLVGVIHGSVGKELQFRWVRGGETLGGTVVPEEGSIPVSETEMRKVGLVGISPYAELAPLPLGRAFHEGWNRTNSWCGQIVGFVGKIFKREVNRDMVGGPLRIGELAGESLRWGFPSLVNFLAILSVHLAVLNLIPIPIFDGGQLVLLLAEAVMRRPLNQRIRLVLQQVGFALVVLLMAVVTLLDVGRWIGR